MAPGGGTDDVQADFSLWRVNRLYPAEDYAEQVYAASRDTPEDPIAAQFHGGPFCAIEFAGDVRRIT